MSTSSFIHLKDLHKTFKDIVAVDKFHMEVKQGDIYGFLGPNGAGKSTTIRMLLSLVYPDSGSIRIFNKELSQNRTAILSRIGALIERPDFYNYLSARKNLELLSRYSGIKPERSRIYELLEIVGLADRASSKVKTYSQGMKQRLGIAQSLLHRPDLIILDEPANGLDPKGQHEIRELIKKINQQEKITIVLSSHLLTEIEEIANRMVIINKGQNIVEGEVNKLLNSDELTVTFEVDQPPKALEEFREAGFTPLEKQGAVEIKTAREDIPHLVDRLKNNELKIYSVKPVRSLENYFLNLTQDA